MAWRGQTLDHAGARLRYSSAVLKSEIEVSEGIVPGPSILQETPARKGDRHYTSVRLVKVTQIIMDCGCFRRGSHTEHIIEMGRTH